MDHYDSELGGRLGALHRAIPGLLVLVAVLVLLRGVEGTADALKLQITTFAKSFFGGGEELVQVLLQTMPLAAAAAIAAFAISSHWLKFEGAWSIVALAGIVIAGAVVGGLLRGLVPDTRETAEREPALIAGQSVSEPFPRALVGDAKQGTPPKNGPTHSSNPLSIAVDVSQGRPAEKPALQQLGEIDWLAAPNLENAPPAKIRPLNLLPKMGGIPGIVVMAVNQVLGYLVAYQPRLFLAAILAGSWIGWSWQCRLSRWREQITQCADEALLADEKTGRAA